MAAAVLCDLDGVVWLAHQPIVGSVDAVARLRRGGHRVLFVTNNSSATVEQQEAALAGIGIDARGDVLTSAMAAAAAVLPGDRVLVCGGPGVVQALEARGAAVVLPGDVDDRTGGAAAVDAVMVGFHRHFDYEVMRVAATAVRGGARLIATNDDATYPTPDGPIPGGGAIVAGIATASGVAPEIAGKPHELMAALVAATLLASHDVLDAEVVMVGDRPETDGAFARTLGCRWALVYSGVTPAGELPDDPAPDFAVANLAAVADVVLGSGATGR
jgi:4-nitrophenyl phosphatase